MRFYHFALDVMLMVLVCVTLMFPIGLLKQCLIFMMTIFCLMVGMVLWRFENENTMLLVMSLISVLGCFSLL